MSVSLADFSEESFDCKAWVNGACSGCPEEEPLDKYLSEIEMKLQLLAGACVRERARSAPRADRDVPDQSPCPPHASCVVCANLCETHLGLVV